MLSLVPVVRFRLWRHHGLLCTERKLSGCVIIVLWCLIIVLSWKMLKLFPRVSQDSCQSNITFTFHRNKTALPLILKRVVKWNLTFREESKCRFQTGQDFVLLSGLYLSQGTPDFTDSNLNFTYGLSPRPGSYLNYSRLVHRKLCSRHESNYQRQSGNWMATEKITWDTGGWEGRKAGGGVGRERWFVW